jgi:predicted permease
LRPGRARRERDEERASHLAFEADAIERSGRPRAEAVRAALDRYWPAPSARWRPESLVHDARFAVRGLRRAPGFACLEAGMLAATFTALLSTASALDALLVRPLPFPDGDRLVAIRQTDQARPAGFNVSLPNFRDWSARSRTTDAMAAWHELVRGVAGAGADARPATVVTVTGAFFDVLRVPAALGRTITTADEGRPERVVALSDRLWREMFGARSEVVGAVIRLDGQPVTIVGVMPARFHYPPAADLWESWPLAHQQYLPRNTITERVIARLAPGRTVDEARSDLGAIAAALRAEHPDPAANQATGARVVTLREEWLGPERLFWWLLGLGVAGACLAAWLNLICAHLAREGQRRAAALVQAALGATASRIRQSRLIEAALIVAPAAAASWLAAPWVLDALWSGTDVLSLRMVRPVVTGWPLAGLAVACAGLIALLGSGRAAAPAGAIRVAGVSGAGGARMARIRSWLVGCQVVGATVLLVAAWVTLQAALDILAVPRGFDAKGVVTADLRLPAAPAPAIERRVASVLERLRAVPGVAAAGVVNQLPLAADAGRSPRIASAVIAETDGGRVADAEVGAGFHAVQGDYFEALGIPVHEGRTFESRDTTESPRVAVVSARMARRFWPDGSAIGRRFEVMGADSALAGRAMTVIGVVGDVRTTSLERESLPDYYVTYAQGISIGWRRYLAVRVRGDEASYITAIRDAIRTAAPDAAFTVTPMESRVRHSLARRLIAGTAFAGLAGVAVLLVVTGVYGVLSLLVGSRTREIGVRVALGASAARVRVDVIRSMARPVALGLAAGLGLSIALQRSLHAAGIGRAGVDLPSTAAAASVVAAVWLVGSALPAWRASRVDPARALRSE